MPAHIIGEGLLPMSMAKSFLLSVALLVSTAVAASSDPMPRGAKIPSPEKVESAYVGKTGLWGDDCNGGIYYGPGGQARAWCADASESLGAGPWTVDDHGRLCTNLIWYWPNGSYAGSSPGTYDCIMHVEDGLGFLWRSWPSSDEWWPLLRDPNHVSRYRFQSEVRETKSRLGI